MKSAQSLLKLFLLIVILPEIGCASAPIIEHCITGETQLICHDDRLPTGKQDYVRPANNDICTNAQDFNTLMNWVKEHDR
jgi:hypothetical protein